jgi:hypothetical protein
MEIPGLSDSGTSGSYDNGDQGLFLAGTNDTGNITNTNLQTIDTFAPETSVNQISPYWNSTGSVDVTVTATDNLSGVASVSLFYYNSSDNSTFTGPYQIGSADTTSPYTWTVTFSSQNGSGYYRFYSTGTDNASNVESAPATNDTHCGYDPYDPDTTITAPTNGGYYNSLTNITGTATDNLSGVASVTITIYNSTDGTYWNGSAWAASSTDLSANGTTSWYYSDTGAFPTWATNKAYMVNSTATDNATNTESTPDSNSFTYDTNNPTATITAPVDATWYNSSFANITGTAADTGGSGVANVNITIYNSTGGTYWNGTGNIWDANLTWMNTNGTTSWYNDSDLPTTWTNGTTYIVNATATDNAGNSGTADSNTFYMDTLAPASNATNLSAYWQTTTPITITAIATDNSGSGLKNVSLY